MKQICFLIALLFATQSHAGVPLMPPAKYDRPFEGQMYIHKVSPGEAVRMCQSTRSRPIPRDTEGCLHKRIKGICIIVVSNRPTRAPDVETLIRHERGHCNGWLHITRRVN